MSGKLSDFLNHLGRRSDSEPEITFKGYEVPKPEERPIPQEPAPEPEKTTKQMNSELKIMHPESAAEVKAAADYLMDGCTVFLNLDLLDKPTITRMLDFLQGVTYAVRGKIKQSSEMTYIITPDDVDITDEGE